MAGRGPAMAWWLFLAAYLLSFCSVTAATELDDKTLSLKEQKEKFVAGLEGTSMTEISAMTLVIPVFAVVRELLSLVSGIHKGPTGKDPSDRRGSLPGSVQPWRFETWLLDYAVIVLPTLACMTVAAQHLYVILFLSLALSAALLSLGSLSGAVALQTEGPHREVERNLRSSRKQYLSFYRLTMMMTTCVAILAVDFPVFPRRYAKAETYGTGLMDIGVGSFVVANALVSNNARGTATAKGGGIVRSVSPLLLLGFSRLVLTKGVDYQEHVGEYGVHWNFFFTLAAVALLTAAVPLPPFLSSGVAGVGILAGYQTALSYGGLSEYLMAEERGGGFVNLNKEGLASAIGYWALYLIAVDLGRHLFRGPGDGSRQKERDDSSEIRAGEGSRGGAKWWRWTLHLGLLDVGLWAAAVLLDRHVERVSRRTVRPSLSHSVRSQSLLWCNMAYVVWMLAQNLQVVLTFLVAGLALPPMGIDLYASLDRNLLPVFLLANVLTGAVNMSMNTLGASDGTAFLVLSLYMAAVTLAASLAHAAGLTLKFW